MAAVGDSFDFNKIVQASSTYSDAHRGLLKMLIDRGSLSEKALCAHFVRCYATQHYLDEIDYDQNQLALKNVTEAAVTEMRKQLIDIINAKVQHIGLRLMNARDENKNRKMIVLVSERHYTPALAAASPFDKNELFLVISWLETMLKPDSDGYIAITDALKSARDLPVPMKMEKAQTLIDELFKSDWIQREAGDNITLTTRAVTELGPILRSRYHCATCALCSNVTIRKASMLSCDQCECLIHVTCWNSFAGTPSKDIVRCPGNGCKNQLKKADMAEAIKQIEEARNNPTVTQRTQRARTDDSSRSTQGGRGRKAVRRLVSSDSEHDNDDDMGGGASNSRSQRTNDDDNAMDSDEEFINKTPKKDRKGATQKQPRKKAEKVKEEEDDEEDEDEIFLNKKTRKSRSRSSMANDEEEEEEDAPSGSKSQSQRVHRKHPRRSSAGSSQQKQPRKKSKDDEEEEDYDDEL